MYTLRDFNFENPTLSMTEQSLTGQDANFEIYDFPGEFLTAARGHQLADVRMEEIETAKTVIAGSSNYRAFTAGFHFKLTGHFRGDFNDKTYLLTSIFHCFNQGNVFGSGAGAPSFRYVNTFQCIPHPTKFRPPIKDDIYTDKYGRVKVRFHWDRSRKSGDNTCFIRVAQPWAGAVDSENRSRGGSHLPGKEIRTGR